MYYVNMSCCHAINRPFDNKVITPCPVSIKCLKVISSYLVILITQAARPNLEINISNNTSGNVECHGVSNARKKYHFHGRQLKTDIITYIPDKTMKKIPPQCFDFNLTFVLVF